MPQITALLLSEAFKWSRFELLITPAISTDTKEILSFDAWVLFFPCYMIIDTSAYCAQANHQYAYLLDHGVSNGRHLL